jgi:hypothetical protein
MGTNLDYQTIEKGCNGTFLLHKGRWHLLIEVTGKCYNFGRNYQPSYPGIVLDNSDPIYDQLVISRKTYDLNWINSLPFTLIGATW